MMYACMDPAPEDSGAGEWWCVLTAGHDDHHVAMLGNTVLASWTQAGVVTMYYDRAAGCARHCFAPDVAADSR